MRRSMLLFVAGAAMVSAAATRTVSAAEDCAAVAPRDWMGGACALTDLGSSLARRMDEPTRVSMAENCASASPDRWLVGSWQMQQSTLTIGKKGDGYVWNYDRKVGQMSQTWGEKETAQGTGRVALIKGCRIELKGAYTAFGGPGARGRNPIGWQMDYALDLIAPKYLAGTGLGYGQKPFRVMFTKSE